MQHRAIPMLLFFTSARSGPCRRMASLIAHIARRERTRLRVVEVDIEQRGDLAERLAVERVPTLVLVVERKAVARLTGRASAPKIDAMLERHLAPVGAS